MDVSLASASATRSAELWTRLFGHLLWQEPRLAGATSPALEDLQAVKRPVSSPPPPRCSEVRANLDRSTSPDKSDKKRKLT